MHTFNDELNSAASDIAWQSFRLRRLPRASFKLVTKPGMHTIREAMDQAYWLGNGDLLIALLLSVNVVNFLFYLASAFLFHLRDFEGVWLFAAQPGIAILLTPPVYVLSGIVVLYGLARLFGGRGTFLTTLYTNLLFQVPLVFFVSIFGTIPWGETWLITAHNLLLIAVQLYSAVLQVLTLRAVHQLSQRRAVACVLQLAVLSLPLMLFLSILIL